MDIKRSHPERRRQSGHARFSTLLIGLLCVSSGVVLGAMVREIAGAKSDDNRLAVSTSPVSPDSLSAAFARAAALVEPAVVHIKVADSNWSFREGLGSGVIVNPAGFILTNEHVIKGAARIRAKLADGREFDAAIIGEDKQTDLSVIKINATQPLPTARIGDSDRLNVGDWVLAIGSPFGLQQTVTAGIISAKDREDDAGGTPFQQFLQTDAAINPGNSGGPLVNLAGEVIGINTQIATQTGAYSGISFALPSSTAVDIYNQLIATGRVRRAFLGVTPQEITPQIARVNRIADGQGVVVRELTEADTPAGRAGIKSGDVIIGINGAKVKSVRELIRRIASLPVGSVATIDYVRNGDRRTASVKLEERQEDSTPQVRIRQLPPERNAPRTEPPKPNEGANRGGQPRSHGITARTLTRDQARLNRMEGAEGAIVTLIEPGSVADRSGIVLDDVIVEINGKPVRSEEEFHKLMRQLRSGDDVVVKVLRHAVPVSRAWIVSFTMP
jgi:serine protease Do